MALRRITITEAKDLLAKGYNVKIVDGVAYTDAPIDIIPEKEIDGLSEIKRLIESVKIINSKLNDIENNKLPNVQTKLNDHESRLTVLERVR